MKKIWYLIIGLLIFYSVSIIITQKTPSLTSEGQLEVDFVTSFVMSAFFLYGAYIIWDEIIR